MDNLSPFKNGEKTFINIMYPFSLSFGKKILNVVVHMIVIDQWNQTARLLEIQVTITYSRVFFLSLWCQSVV